MKTQKTLKKVAVVGIATVMTVASSALAFGSDLLMRAYHAEYVDPANVDANLYLYEDYGTSTLDSDEDCELYLYGYVQDNAEGNKYYFRAYTGSGRSIGASQEVPFLTERIESEYKVSSEYSGSTLPTMSLDIYEDYDDVKYY